METGSRLRPQKTPAQRAGILAEYQQRALSAALVARRHGISPSTLFRWLRHAPAPSASGGAAWIEVPNPLSRGAAAVPAYCLRFANGVALELSCGFQPEEVRALAQVVRGL